MAVFIPNDSADNESLYLIDAVDGRSRASSLVSTSTRFTTSTTATPRATAIDSRQDFIMIDRPPSLFSIVSQPLPPYQLEDHGHQPQTPVGQVGTSDSGSPSPTPTGPSERANDAANAIALHYRGMIQTIDQNHVNEVQRLQTTHREETDALRRAHREEIGALRHDIDQAYRREFRAVRQEMERVREESASQVEKAQREADSRIATLTAEHEGHIEHIQEDMRQKDDRSEEREFKLRKEYEAALIEASQRLRQRHFEPDIQDIPWSTQEARQVQVRQ